MANDVTYTRPEYDKAVPIWELVADASAGQRAIKARDISHNTEKRYLPMPNPLDQSPENLARYDQYLFRAIYYNATGRTLSGLVGTAFRLEPTTELGSIEYLLSDADGRGVGLLQQMQSSLAAILKTGRHGLWVDYPTTERSSSRAEMAERKVQANVISTKAEQIINWRTKKVGAQELLSLVVIREMIEEVGSDGFSSDYIEQYRALLLEESVYTVQVWRVQNKSVELVEQYQPLDGSGKTWDIIPFAFIGSVDNNPEPDPVPLYDLAELNLGHYRNSADYEDSCFFVGQAQPWISGLDENWRDHLEAQGMYVGSRAPILLPEGGAFGIEQAEPNTLVHEAMLHKEQQMIALGARLVQRGTALKTATEAQGELENEHSVLSLIVENVSEAYSTALGWAARYMNTGEDVSVEINRDFVEHSLDAQRLTALVGAWQAGALPNSDMWAEMRRAGLIDPEKDDNDIIEEINSDPTGLALDDDGEGGGEE